MPRQQSLRIVLLVGVAIIAAGLLSFGQEKDQPRRQSANARARRDAAKKVYESSWQVHVQSPEQGPGKVEHYHEWSVRWMQAERELSQTKADQITALEGHLKRMQFWQERLDALVKLGDGAVYDASAAEFFRLEAEDLLAAAKAEDK